MNQFTTARNPAPFFPAQRLHRLPPTSMQLAFLRAFGHSTEAPQSRAEAARLLASLKFGKRQQKEAAR